MTTLDTPTAVTYTPAPLALTPVRLLILSTLRIALADDAAALRCLGRLEQAMAEGKVIMTAFDSAEMRCLSTSRGRDVEHVTTAEGCTCEGKGHAWCIHRMLFREQLAEYAMTDPAWLMDSIAVQTQDTPAPHGDEPPPPDERDRPWANDAAYLAYYESQFGYDD